MRCYEVKIAEGRKRKGRSAGNESALWRGLVSEIHNVMERDNTEKTHREGWLKRVLEEANDYDIPELIDPDEYEESTPDLVPSDEDGVGRVGSDNDGGAMPVLFESEADGFSGGSDEAPQKHSWSHKDMEYEHSNVRENPEDTRVSPAVTKGKATTYRRNR